MIKWGMIGCGDVTEVKSGPAFNITQKSRLFGVVSRTESSAIDYAKRHNVPHVFQTISDLIDCSEIDAVYIATPPSSHAELALKVARANKPCCIEKPIANNYSDALQVTDAFKTSGVPLFVSYYRRSLPRFLTIRSWISDGKIGNVRHIHWGLMQRPKPEDIDQNYAWRKDPNHVPGGYFDDLACHGLDLFDFFLGEITQANGISVNQQGIYDVPDSVSAVWQHTGNITGTAFWNFSGYEDSDEVVILGDKGKIIFSIFDDTCPRYETKDDIVSVDIDHPKHVQQYHVEGMVNQLLGRSNYNSTGENATRTAWVCEQILS